MSAVGFANAPVSKGVIILTTLASLGGTQTCVFLVISCAVMVLEDCTLLGVNMLRSCCCIPVSDQWAVRCSLGGKGRHAGPALAQRIARQEGTVARGDVSAGILQCRRAGHWHPSAPHAPPI